MFVLFIRDCNHSIHLEIKYTYCSVYRYMHNRQASICQHRGRTASIWKTCRMHAFRNSFDYRCGNKRFRIDHSLELNIVVFVNGKFQRFERPDINAFYKVCLSKLTSGDKQKLIVSFHHLFSPLCHFWGFRAFFFSPLLLSLTSVSPLLFQSLQQILRSSFAHLLLPCLIVERQPLTSKRSSTKCWITPEKYIWLETICIIRVDVVKRSCVRFGVAAYVIPIVNMPNRIYKFVFANCIWLRHTSSKNIPSKSPNSV